ncbi:MAG: 50S ribosomal protein L15 [Patescibacteria group bacterium]
MQLHELRPTTKNKSKKRVGRGGKRGTFSGRGTKGQKARAGHRMRPELRDILKKLPKKRGYRAPSIQEKPAVINLEVLNRHYKDSETVSPKTLDEKGLLKPVGGRRPSVKILGSGELSKKLLVVKCQISKSAKAAVEKAGGKVK